jgi:hypothetical protein
MPSELVRVGEGISLYRVSDGVLTPVVSPTLLGTQSPLVHKTPSRQIKNATSCESDALSNLLKLV